MNLLIMKQVSFLYPRLLGAQWSELDPSVRRAHFQGAPVRARGHFSIGCGDGRIARFLAVVLGLPAAGKDVGARLSIDGSASIERWSRSFGMQGLETIQWESAGRFLTDRFGIIEFRFRLAVSRGMLSFRQHGSGFRLGWAYLPLPRWLSPHVEALESPTAHPDRPFALYLHDAWPMYRRDPG